MLLQKFKLQHVGPFAIATEVLLEDDVTVLVGANDTGKSSILNAIELVCGAKGKKGGRTLQERDVNLDRIGKTAHSWQEDEGITCDVFFRGTSFSNKHTAGNVGPDHELSFSCFLCPQKHRLHGLRWRVLPTNRWSSGGAVEVTRLPEVIRLPLEDQIRPIIDLELPNKAEREFLRAAFGPKFSFTSHATVSESQFSTLVSKAKGTANTKLKRILPKKMAFVFDFQTVGGDRQKLSIQLRDGNDAHTPIDLRGSGIQKLVSFMGVLMATPLDSSHYIILFDEPENSLHPDAQRILRGVLETLGAKPNIQVVYATHSPVMINTMRPWSLRLVEREVRDGVPTTVVNHRPVDANYLSVRQSLGISASDSLQYAPVTIIAEGVSEAIGLPLILGRLWKAGVNGFEDVGQVLPQSHIIDGIGTNFEKFCRFALSQGSKPILFLDGDHSEAELARLRSTFPTVPIISLPDGKEFEDIVPPTQFFASLALKQA